MKKPEPVTDPHELVSLQADDYQRNMKRQGIDLSREDAIRVAAEDLNLVDRYNSENPPPPEEKLTPDPADVVPPESREAGKMAGEVGGKFRQRQDDDKPNTVDSSGRELDQAKIETLSALQFEKRQKLVRRVKELMTVQCTKQHTHERPCFVYKEFGPMIRDIHIDWTLCRRLFRPCKNQRERDLVFFRLLENVCDASNGHPGLPAWWVK